MFCVTLYQSESSGESEHYGYKHSYKLTVTCYLIVHSIFCLLCYMTTVILTPTGVDAASFQRSVSVSVVN